MTNQFTSLFVLIAVFGGPIVFGMLVSYLLKRSSKEQSTTQRAPTVPAPSARSLPSALPDAEPTTTRLNIPLPYMRTATLLSAAEQEFFAVALRAIPEDMLLFPQVRLASLVHTLEQEPQRKKYDFYRIQAKTVDFVLCDARTTTPRLVIELDDSSHHRADRQKRDAFVDEVLASAGLPILHVRWSPRYDVDRVRAAIFEQLVRAIYLPQAAALPNHTEPARTSSAHTRANVAERPLRPAAPPPHTSAIPYYGATGYSYESIIGPYLHDAQAIVVEDPYIRLTHQIQNFVRLCEVVVAQSAIKQITLITSYDDQTQLAEMQGKFADLTQSLLEIDIVLNVKYSPTIHDREIRIDNGWVIKIGRGLDFYQKPSSWFELGTNDLALRKCLETKVDIFRANRSYNPSISIASSIVSVPRYERITGKSYTR